jgi:DNA adenine methylase
MAGQDREMIEKLRVKRRSVTVPLSSHPIRRSALPNGPDGVRVSEELVAVGPFLRWAGSKRRLLPKLAQFWGVHYQRYVEPFAGCAALFFRIQPASALLADINGELIETYDVVRENPDALYEALMAIPGGEDQYYQVRDKNPFRLTKFSRAVRFVYLNRHCFNGIYRTNNEGRFNVPFGGQKPGRIPPVEVFRKCARLLQRATLRTCDFGHVLRDTRQGDFVYLDPPYAVESRRVFREYDPRGFVRTDLDRLAGHLMRMDSRGVHFVVSYADCAEARAVLAGWRPTRVRVRRNVAGFAGSRRTAYELVATNIAQKGRP